MKFHPLCEQFPMMSDQELIELGEDILKHGQLEPGLTLDGMILDGRNRYRACEIVGVEFQSIPYRGKSPSELVRSLNIYRRHLTESQRAFLVAQVCNLQAGVHKSNTPAGVAQSEAAREAKVSVRSVSRAAEVVKKGSEELKKSVKSGTLSVRSAANLTKLSKNKQDAVIVKGPRHARNVAASIAKPRRNMPFSSYKEVPTVKQSLPVEPAAVNGDPALTAVNNPISVIDLCYEQNKSKWNNPPPPAPIAIHDAYKSALKKAGY